MTPYTMPCVKRWPQRIGLSLLSLAAIVESTGTGYEAVLGVVREVVAHVRAGPVTSAAR